MDGNVCGGVVQACAMTCIIDPFNPWPGYKPTYVPPTYVPIGPAPNHHTHYHFSPVPQKLSDEDVERIARRVAEILREVKP